MVLREIVLTLMLLDLFLFKTPVSIGVGEDHNNLKDWFHVKLGKVIGVR